VTRALAADASDASSTLTLLAGVGVLFGLGYSGLRALPGLRADQTVQTSSSIEYDDDDDSGLRWGVAGFVACFPLVGFAAWFLPAMGGEVAGGSSSGDANSSSSDANISNTQTQQRNKRRYLACAALYGVAYVSTHFDATDPVTWATAAACAAHVQLERVSFEAERNETFAVARGKKKNSKTKQKHVLEAPKAKTILDVFVRSAVSEEQRAAVAEGTGESDAENKKTERNLAAKKTWAGGFDSLAKNNPSIPSPPRLSPISVPVSELTVRGVGRAIGRTQIAAAKLRDEIEEGKLAASIEESDAVERERLTREGVVIGAEIFDWDARFEIRTMTREQLLAIAREKGMKGYSKLRRLELLDAVETALYEDDR
jgi:hypothetical protein|tara:strand:+ start:194 stop:1306 length:1113 start_codon:yes stop_codon:yes gene_type:complete